MTKIAGLFERLKDLDLGSPFAEAVAAMNPLFDAAPEEPQSDG